MYSCLSLTKNSFIPDVFDIKSVQLNSSEQAENMYQVIEAGNNAKEIIWNDIDLLKGEN